MDTEYNYVCSLGTMCHSASIIKQLGAKKASYPFDWSHSTPTLIAHCIQDDFKIFLDREYYFCYSNRGGGCGHKFYDDFLYKSNADYHLKDTFPHMRPDANNEHYEYYVRCVTRFRELLNRNNNKLFIIMYVNREADLEEEIKKEIIQMGLRLSKHTTNFKICCIVHHPNKKHEIRKSCCENIDFLDYFTETRSNGMGFGSHEDNIRIIEYLKSNYNLVPLNYYKK